MGKRMTDDRFSEVSCEVSSVCAVITHHGDDDVEALISEAIRARESEERLADALALLWEEANDEQRTEAKLVLSMPCKLAVIDALSAAGVKT